MAADDLRGFSSAFDAMLDRSRKEFDALLSGSGAAPQARPAVSSVTARPSSQRSLDQALQIYKQTESARRLTQRFGARWRAEVVERQREADEVIALCRLRVPDENIVRSQFGVANVRDVPGRDEDAALHAAVSDALARCASTLD